MFQGDVVSIYVAAAAGIPTESLQQAEAIAGRGSIIYDMSVGYDLKGIQSPQVRAFIEGVQDASAVIDKRIVLGRERRISTNNSR